LDYKNHKKMTVKNTINNFHGISFTNNWKHSGTIMIVLKLFKQ